MKLLTSDYEIEIKADNMSEFTVILDGPPDSPYEGVSTFLILRENFYSQFLSNYF